MSTARIRRANALLTVREPAISGCTSRPFPAKPKKKKRPPISRRALLNSRVGLLTVELLARRLDVRLDLAVQRVQQLRRGFRLVASPARHVQVDHGRHIRCKLDLRASAGSVGLRGLLNLRQSARCKVIRRE